MFLNESSVSNILEFMGAEGWMTLPFFTNTERQGFIQRNFTIKVLYYSCYYASKYCCH